MSVPRRRLLRPVIQANNAANQKLVQSLRTRLEREQLSLGRWMSKLKRAFHFVEKQQRTVARLERRLRQQEET